MLSDHKQGAALKLPCSEGAIALHALDQNRARLSDFGSFALVLPCIRRRKVAPPHMFHTALR
jgi:hypothetical protein